MFDKNNLEEQLTTFLKKEYSDIDKAKFYPCVDLSHGDIYTDCILNITKKYKEDVENISKMINKDLFNGFDQNIEFGFINLRFNKLDIKDYEIFHPQIEKKNVLIFVPAIKEYPFSLFVRLCFKAFLQKRLFKNYNINATLYLGNNEEKEENIVNFSKSLKSIFEIQKIKDSLCVLDEINKNNKSSEKFLVLLGANSNYQKKFATHVFKKEENRKKFILDFSPKDWSYLYESEEEEIEKFINLNENENILNNLSFLFSSKKYFNELDIYISQNKERDNFAYYFNLTRENLKKYFTTDVFNDKKEINIDLTRLDSEKREILIRTFLLNEVLVTCLYNCHLEEFIDYLDKLLNLINKAINTPDYREKILKNTLSDIEKFIFNYAFVVFREFAI